MRAIWLANAIPSKSIFNPPRKFVFICLVIFAIVASLAYTSSVTSAGTGSSRFFASSSSVAGVWDALLNPSGRNEQGGSPFTASFAAVASSTAFTVNSTVDIDDSNLLDSLCDDGSGNCTLRAAIEQSNATIGVQTIEFNIAGAGPHAIKPASALPTIADPVVIDGFTQPGASPNTNDTSKPINAVMVIELDGSNAGDGARGLHITAGDSTVRGLVINRFAGSGVALETNGGNTIEGNFIGTDVTGTTASGPPAGPTPPTYTVTAEPETSGTYSTGTDRSGFVSQTDDPIGPWSGESVHFLGTDVGGSQVQVNGEFLVYRYRLEFDSEATLDSISVTGAAFNGDQSELRVLDESMNLLGSVSVTGGNTYQTHTVILPSVQGTVFFLEELEDSSHWRYRESFEINGPTSIGNGSAGVLIFGGSSSNLIGGDTSAARNVVSGNNDDGIHLAGPGIFDNFVSGNNIGTDITGTVDLGNSAHGVFVGSSAQSNIIGGSTPNERNIISGNSRNGVEFAGGAYENVVKGNYIGTDITGTSELGNSINGIHMESGATSNTVGGNTVADRNIISGNGLNGIRLSDPGTADNIISGNFIGTDFTGTLAIGNLRSGVFVQESANSNIVGGDGLGQGNVISGNGNSGIVVRDSNNGDIQSNYIGTDVTGTVALGNNEFGVDIRDDSQSNVIGHGNLISGNGENGVVIRHGGADNNLVIGNLIGTDVSGTLALGNGDRGIALWGGAQQNLIEANVISGNNHSGVLINDTGTDFNTLTGNYIGTDHSGTVSLPNGWEGVIIWDGPQQNVIGGSLSSDANVISGNDGEGVGISQPGSDRNIVLGNFIGTDPSGTSAIPNGGSGVGISDGAQFNIIGSSDNDWDERNIISGNNDSGVTISDWGADKNVVTGNYIGTTVDGIEPLGNGEFGVDIRDGAQNNIIGGDGGEGNVISGNASWGVAIRHGGADKNEVSGNYIGTDHNGLVALPNAEGGVRIWGGAQSNVIGGDTFAGEGNVVSGNDGNGIGLYDSSTNGNIVSGNLIGTDATGQLPLANANNGVAFGNGAAANIIGGTTESSRNIISGNHDNGIGIWNDTTNNVISGNYIGTDRTGTTPLGNLCNGINIQDVATNNIIGGSVPGAGNVISGNLCNGVELGSDGTTGNLIQGNLVGTDYTGTQDLGNGGSAGVYICCGATGNIVGVITEESGRNVLSGNTRGVFIDGGGDDNHVQGNYIGTDITGTQPLGNAIEGVVIQDAYNNTVGGPNTLLRNVISDNQRGVHIEGDASGNDVQGNYIGTDVTGTQPLGNSESGVWIGRGASGNTIGGTPNGAGNVIAFNDQGVRVESGTENTIDPNSIFDNDGLGIDLGGDGRTYNDAGDGDGGANNRQNFPERLTALIEAGGDLVIDYLVDSDTGNSAYPLLIEFFVADTDGEEGKTFIAKDSYLAADAQSLRSINLGNAATLGVPPGSPVVATATDVNGNTSEFSDATIAGALITTVAGIGPGFGGDGGDGGDAIDARLSQPQRLAMDADDNLYVADRGNHRIRRVTPDGVITTVAGNGEAGFSGDGGPATEVSLNGPTGVAVDDVNNILYIADSLNNRVRAVDLVTGVISTAAGNGEGHFSVTAFATDVIAESPSHGTSDELLGPPDGGFVSFDDDGSQAGSVTVAFNDGLILDGPGDDLAIHLFDFPEWEDEDFEVFVSDDGSSFISLGIVVPTSDEGGVYDTEYFDISSSGLTSASHVKIVNVRFDLDDEFEGPEIDSIEALNTDRNVAATDTGLSHPADVAVNAAGDTLYIADRFNNSVRSVDLNTGFITNFAGTGDWGFSGDGGPAVDAELNQPMGLGIDSGGNLHIADRWNNRIRKVDVSTSVITTVAGNGCCGFGGDGGPATDALLSEPADVAFDSAGNMFIADRNRNRRIRKVDTGGTITTIAGDAPIGPDGDNGDGGPATAARLWNPVGVAVDYSGNVLISDTLGHRVRRVDASTDVITTYAGTYPPGFSGDGGPATSALLNTPTMVAIDAQDNLYISDRFNHRIRMVDADGIITTVAGNGTPTGYIDGEGGDPTDDLGDGGPAVDATLNNPTDIVVDGSGNMYVADTVNFRIRKVDASGVITTVAGNGIETGSIDGEGGDPADDLGDDGLAINATITNAFAIEVDATGNLYISDRRNHRIRKVDAITGIITTVVGNGSAGFCGDGGPATSACLNIPVGIAINDISGDLYIAERNNHRIRKVDAVTGIISTVAGNGNCCFDGDGGLATDAKLHNPYDIDFDAVGNMFIADFLNMRIRRVDAVTGIITTVAGSGSTDEIDSSFSGDGGPATEAEMTAVLGLALDSQGNLFIPDMLNHVIRKVHGIGAPSSSAKVVTLSGEGEAVVGDQYFLAVATPPGATVYMGGSGAMALLSSVGPPSSGGSSGSRTMLTSIEDVPEILVRMHGLELVGDTETTHVWLGQVEDGPSGVREIEITIEESGGISRTLSTSLNVVDMRSNRNYFLMPGTNYVGLGQIPDDSSIEALFEQTVPNANPAFEQELGRSITLADVVEKVYAFSNDGSFLTYFTADPVTGVDGPANTLTDLAPYQGMIIITRESVEPDGGGTPIEVFSQAAMSGQVDPQAVPIKMTVDGAFLDVGGTSPVTKTMRFEWNLVAPHVQEAALFENVFSNALAPKKLTSSAITYRHEVAANAGSISAELVNVFATVFEGGEITPNYAYWVFITDTGEEIDRPVMVPQASP